MQADIDMAGPLARAPERHADAVLALLDRAAGLVVIAAIAAMVGVVATQVFMRYVMNSSIGWADEVSRLAFVWSIFLAIPLGIRRGAHIGIELLTGRFPARVRDGLARAMAAAGAGIAGLVCYETIILAEAQWDELMMTVDQSASLFLVPLAVGMAHTVLHLVRIVAFGPYPAAFAPGATE